MGESADNVVHANYASVSRGIGRLEGRVEGIESRLALAEA